jgi:hypothetical protein
MNCKRALKSGIIAVTLLVAAILTTQQPEVQASDNNDDDNDNPLSGALRDLASGIDESDAGTEVGRDQAREDFYSGKQFKTPCPREPGPWCFGYNTGYDGVMNSLESAHR